MPLVYMRGYQNFMPFPCLCMLCQLDSVLVSQQVTSVLPSFSYVLLVHQVGVVHHYLGRFWEIPLLSDKQD